MAINIRQILNKKNLRGSEVGKALVYNTAAAYENLLKTKDYSHDPKGIFGQAEMDRMVNSLNTSYDIDAYISYVRLNNYIAKEQGFVNAYQQQSQLGYYKILHLLQGALSYEESLQDLSRQPLVVTQKQYDDYVQQAMERGRGLEVRYPTFLLDIFNYYYTRYKESPRKKNPLTAAIKASKEKTIINERINSEYVEMWGCGHYVTKDGISSDDCTQEEWEDILEDNLFRGPDGNSIFTDCEESSFTIRCYVERLKKAEKELTTGIVDEVDQYLAWVDDEPPTELSGEDILNNLDEYYPQVFEYSDTKEEFEQQFNEFKQDFPELLEALQKEASRLLPAAKTFKVADYEKKIATWGELADKKILDFEKKTNSISVYEISELIEGKKETCQAAFNGIAILRDEDIKDSNIDENGYYVSKGISLVLDRKSVTSLAADDDTKQYIEEAREEELKGALREVYAYNTIIDLISETIGVDVSVFSLVGNTILFEQQIEAFNGLVLRLYDKVRDNAPMFSEEDRERRIKCAKALFPLIDLSDLTPTAEAIEETRKYINDLKAFDTNTPVIIEMLKNKGGAANE